jgi:uncharacterized repeat protein (TIGR01451 family)
MDENGSKMMIDASFTGKGSIGFYKKSSPEDGPKSKPIFDSQEDYSGRFSINETFEEYGKNIDTVKSVSGEGLVSSDKRVRTSQRTYESGTGSYKSEELVDSFTSYIAKDIELEHRPVSYNYTPGIYAKQDMKWTEGMWSKNGILRGGTIVSANNSAGEPIEDKPCNTSDIGSAPATLISERYSSLEYLKKDSVALGLNEMKTNATFEGVADFRAKSVGVNATDEVDNEERYAGSFAINRHVLMTGVSKYDYPHIIVGKTGVMRDETVNGVKSKVVDYTITVTNDGNRALAPLYVWDTFPPGTEYLGSSVKPAELSTTVANWTILHLGIGNTLSINLKLNVTDLAPYSLVNCVTASGITGTSVVSSTNCTGIELDWLGCCQPKVSVEKKAELDPLDPTVILYTILVKNNASSHMTAKLVDEISADMTFLDSSADPYSIDSSSIHWAIADLAPGEVSTIEYRMRAGRDGTYTSGVHLEAIALDGSGSSSADSSSFVDVTGTGVAPRTLRYDGWQPPDWDLNTSEEGLVI